MVTETLSVVSTETRQLPSGTEKLRVKLSNGGWYDCWEPSLWPLLEAGEMLDFAFGADKNGAAKIVAVARTGSHATATTPSKTERKWLRVVALQSATKTLCNDGPMTRFADDGELDARIANLVLAVADTYLKWLSQPD